ncbi:aspartic peptidase domain-containing protein [Apiosordaria backusii]|uniref:Probable aspartic-type endopeptidase OPSB n=1 Tax=Apiosordaria backusii TaxID=314023 RepID=A0AA40BEE1_9PEZI|nr:aspartic peptidase domain-containing protein [Apiosordaria backusii]
MKTATFLAVAASLTAQTIDALSVPSTTMTTQRRDGSGPRVVGMGIERRTPKNPLHRDKLRRRGSVEVNLDNEETLYFINGTVGTPPRSLRLHLDTGSSDLWVNTPSSSLCSQSSAPCQFAGTYNANSSSTYQYVGSWFNISYVDGSGASGDYVSDTVTFGDATLDRLQFGIGYSSNNAQGILGIGYPINEVQVGRAGMRPYNNLPAQMVAEGLIQSNAYSLWLNDLDANTGNILFGGVDTEKFIPPLYSLPVESEAGVYAEFMITLTKLQLGTTQIGGDLALAVLLDTGSSLTYLPDAMVQDIFNLVNAQYDSDSNAAYVPCSLANDQSTLLSFTFTSPTIHVEMNELVLDLVTSSGKRPVFSDGTEACLFGIAPAGQGTNVLGDTFLRSAYVVYDLENDEISLAGTNFNITRTEIQEITKGEGGVPGATKVVNPTRATEGLHGPNSMGGISFGNRVGVKRRWMLGVVVGVVGLVVMV